MNLAFPAAVLFAFLLPGFLLRDAFRRPEGSLPDPTPFARRIVWSFLLTLLLNAVWCTAAQSLTSYRVDWEALLLLVSGDHGSAYESAVQRIVSHPEGPMLYLFSLCIAAWAMGAFPRHLILSLRLDREGRPGAAWLRADTPWYYLLSGYDTETMPDVVHISAVVEIGKEAYLYVGLLNDYFLDSSGTLDRLVLSEVSRRPMGIDRTGALQEESGAESANHRTGGDSRGADDAAVSAMLDEEDRFYPIEGDYFVLKGSEIRTLNIRYLQFEID